MNHSSRLTIKEESSFIYLNISTILDSCFNINYTHLLNNLVDSQKKKKIILSKFLQCLQKTSLKKGNASKQWCFCCSRVNGHGKTKYACL